MSTEKYQQDGYLIIPRFLDSATVEKLRSEALAELQALEEPLEFEADVGYPGAPASRNATGGATPRRLLSAYSRNALWRELATLPQLGAHLKSLIGETVYLSQSHHNCVMTKHPGYSSATHWHQDIRYWSFTRPELISAWFALTKETADNGALLVIPGSHRLDLESGRFDEQMFFRHDLAANKPLIAEAIQVELDPGDLMLFHCRTLHAAGKNTTDRVKLSAVFTYHGLTNSPLPDQKSSLYAPVPIPVSAEYQLCD